MTKANKYMPDTTEKSTFGIKQTLFNQMLPRRSNFNGYFLLIYLFAVEKKAQ